MDSKQTETKQAQEQIWTNEKLRQLLMLLENWPSVTASVDSKLDTPYLSRSQPCIYFHQQIEETVTHTSGLEVSTIDDDCVASTHPSRQYGDHEFKWKWQFTDFHRSSPFVITREEMLKQMQKWIQAKTFPSLPTQATGKVTIAQKIVAQHLRVSGSLQNMYKAGTKIIITKDETSIPFISGGPTANSIYAIIQAS